MNDLTELKRISGIINESKYGSKFDNFKSPFKHDGKKVVDNNGSTICECTNTDLAKELANILSDIRKMREICERFISLPRS